MNDTKIAATLSLVVAGLLFLHNRNTHLTFTPKEMAKLINSDGVMIFDTKRGSFGVVNMAMERGRYDKIMMDYVSRVPKS